jgi:hypothetical protein
MFAEQGFKVSRRSCGTAHRYRFAYQSERKSKQRQGMRATLRDSSGHQLGHQSERK